jgi:uncharacterized membrane protein YjjP (DUF1212 family)
MNSRWKNPILITGFASILIILVRKYLGYELPTIFAEELVQLLLYAIIGIAIANNPSDPKNF